jgi:DNA-binding CsgD family transcriptional regulator
MMVHYKDVAASGNEVIEMPLSAASGHLSLHHDGARLSEVFFASAAIGSRDPELSRIHENFDDPQAACDLELLSGLAPNCLLHLVDARSHDPAGFRVARYDTRATLDGGRDYTGLVFGDYPVAVYRENLEHQVGTAWIMGVRRYSEVSWAREGGERRRFNRLLVPMRRARASHERGDVLIATHPCDRVAGDAKADLTAREVEILYWTTQGKTSQDISRIIGRSAATVNFHLQSAMVKLDAVNKTQAAIKAHQLGYLGIGSH